MHWCGPCTFPFYSGLIRINLAQNDKKIDLLILVKLFCLLFFLSLISVSCNNLIIAIGLCIDYASHIAHRFLIEPGPDRNSRIRSTLENIGPVGYGVSNSRLQNLPDFINKCNCIQGNYCILWIEIAPVTFNSWSLIF